MKKTLFWSLKAIIALLISFVILTLFCHFYYNLPVHHNSKTGSTDRVWDSNGISIRGNEGFALSKIDDKGFVNTYPNDKDTVDILVMGSSHTEGFNVNSDENYTYLLNKQLDEKGIDMYAYNIGMSGHPMVRCFRNLEAAIEEFAPTGYVTIETSNLDATLEELTALSEGKYETLYSVESGIISMLQKNDYLRLIYSQLENALKQSEAGGSDKKEEDMTEYCKYLDEMLKNASEICKNADLELIVVYKPDLVIDYDGNVEDETFDEKDEFFLEIAEKYGITVLDMYSPFAEYYNETYCLPNGFSNTKVGVGHLNPHGHKVIAEELFDCITEVGK